MPFPHVVLSGEYSVPLGAVGAMADRTILAGAAKSSLRTPLTEAFGIARRHSHPPTHSSSTLFERDRFAAYEAVRNHA